MTICPACKAPLAADAPAGLCPACLLAPAPMALERATAEAAIRAAFAEHVPGLVLAECIGRGGSGLVFRARQAEPAREVAVKVLDPELAREPAFAERFAREAEALARLTHAHIVAVHGHGRAGEHFYLVLEHLAGGNARELLAHGPLAPKRALALVTEVAQALEFAHAQGIVHRDIKPENLLLDRAGHAKVADFGLARFADVRDARLALTSTGRALGTLRYMAPEQLERPESVDPRADLYALGVVFYELLTGEVPMGRFEPPSKRAGVDPRLDEIVLHLLDRDPERRYANTSELHNDLLAVERGETPRQATPPKRRPSRRFSWLAVCSAVISIGSFTAFHLEFAFFFLFLTPGTEVKFGSGAAQTGSAGFLAQQVGYFILFVILFWFFLFPYLLSGLLGRAAIERIRALWPELYGVGAAVIGLWLLPLGLLNLILGVGLATLLEASSVEGTPALWALGSSWMIALAFDGWWIARRRRRILDELEGATGSG